MKRFSRLFTELDATTSTNEKVEALARYFAQAPARDAAWAVYFLAGGKPRQVVRTASLATLACEVAGIAPRRHGYVEQLVVPAASPPRVSCTIGEQMWQRRWGGGGGMQ